MDVFQNAAARNVLYRTAGWVLIAAGIAGVGVLLWYSGLDFFLRRSLSWWWSFEGFTFLAVLALAPVGIFYLVVKPGQQRAPALLTSVIFMLIAVVWFLLTFSLMWVGAETLMFAALVLFVILGLIPAVAAYVWALFCLFFYIFFQRKKFAGEAGSST